MSVSMVESRTSPIATRSLTPTLRATTATGGGGGHTQPTTQHSDSSHVAIASLSTVGGGQRLPNGATQFGWMGAGGTEIAVVRTSLSHVPADALDATASVPTVDGKLTSSMRTTQAERLRSMREMRSYIDLVRRRALGESVPNVLSKSCSAGSYLPSLAASVNLMSASHHSAAPHADGPAAHPQPPEAATTTIIERAPAGDTAAATTSPPQQQEDGAATTAAPVAEPAVAPAAASGQWEELQHSPSMEETVVAHASLTLAAMIRSSSFRIALSASRRNSSQSLPTSQLHPRQ